MVLGKPSKPVIRLAHENGYRRATLSSYLKDFTPKIAEVYYYNRAVA